MKLKKSNRVPDEYFVPLTIVDPRSTKNTLKNRRTSHNKTRNKKTQGNNSIFLDEETIDVLKYKKVTSETKRTPYDQQYA